MARLNTHPSATPQPQGRASSLRSSYRESTYSVFSPAPSQTSDKENEQPVSRDGTPRLGSKDKRPMAANSARLPTPVSGGSGSNNGNKRRRTGDYSVVVSSGIYVDEDDLDVFGDQDAEEVGSTLTPGDDDEDEGTKYYDPQQDPELRRELRANIRKNHREMEDNRDELIQPGNNKLLEHLKRQDFYMGKVRQTSDAALDSRVMVLASDLAGKRLNKSLHGNAGAGLDVDQFVSKCIYFMKTGGAPTPNGDRHASSSTQARNRRQIRAEEDEDEDDIGDGLDWATLGRDACFQWNRRPPVPTFLLGPLSVQKRARTTQSRRARSQRQPVGPTTRPQELQQSDIKQSENSNLTHLVKGIRGQLMRHIEAGEQKIDQELQELDVEEPDSEDVDAAMRRQRIHQSAEGEACVSLFDFVVNPRSFGQTVENLFYVSFLIREGNVSVVQDQHGLPLLLPSEPHRIEEQRDQNVQKHQAVFSIDYKTWKTLIDAFDIKEPLIPHRVPEETNVQAGGWYG